MNMQIFSLSLFYSFKFEEATLEQALISCTFNFIIMKYNMYVRHMYVMFFAFFKNNNIILIRNNIKTFCSSLLNR